MTFCPDESCLLFGRDLHDSVPRILTSLKLAIISQGLLSYFTNHSLIDSSFYFVKDISQCANALSNDSFEEINFANAFSLFDSKFLRDGVSE